MLNPIVHAFTKGDLANLNSKILHSAFWEQHNTKRYGPEKLNIILSSWLAHVGKCSLLEQQTIAQDNHFVIHITFMPENNKNAITCILWLETDQVNIKSVYSLIDTIQVANASKFDLTHILNSLPTADPLVISDYDQQDHLQHEFAWPSMLVTNTPEIEETLDSWWAIYSQKQLCNIDKLYTGSAIINLPGTEKTQGRDALFDFVLLQFSQLTRTFAQIEEIAIENNNIAIKWFLDADEFSNKIRIPFISILQIEENKIISDTTSCDILALKKRFTDTSLFSDFC